MNEEFSSIEINIFTSIFSHVHSIENPKSVAGVAILDAIISVTRSDKDEEGDQIFQQPEQRTEVKQIG